PLNAGLLFRFKALVRETGDWDLKVPLGMKLGDVRRTPVGGDPAPETLFYDVWGNIHYGYVGRAHGIPADVVHAGAETFGGARSVSDWISNEIGIQLWEAHGAALTKTQLASAVLAKIRVFRADPADTFLEVRGGLAP
ncbi:MAG: hypothetical protein EPO09_21120, partial [Aquabacterium sp.]|uniref:polymorphic toxin type 44 domain-containing protein n=1 Tax=Aquabacterium sp. TaxID=1872578 RepID=UPI00121CD69D